MSARQHHFLEFRVQSKLTWLLAEFSSLEHKTKSPFSWWLSEGATQLLEVAQFLVKWSSHMACHIMVTSFFKASRRISVSSVVRQSLMLCDKIKGVTLPLPLIYPISLKQVSVSATPQWSGGDDTKVWATGVILAFCHYIYITYIYVSSCISRILLCYKTQEPSLS